jgi:hypothetical protein
MIGGGSSNREARSSAARGGDMAACEAEDDVSVIAEAEVSANGALGGLPLEQGDGETGFEVKGWWNSVVSPSRSG